ncbi:MAG: homoserine O-succinyltransferase [Alphaproteobacteria bacterium]|nr:homoserine O-succinyltransferase [Alphaproteobacteria bacterium]
MGRTDSYFPVSSADVLPARSPVVALVNIMDNAEGTERHFRRMIEAANPSAEIILCRMSCASQDPKYFKEQNYLLSNRYANWHEVIGQRPIDLVIVTGINRGGLTYKELREEYPHFWNETSELLTTIKYATKAGKIGHSLLVCWSAFAAMKLFSGVDKGIYDRKLLGLFEHHVAKANHPLLQQLNLPSLRVPHSRFSYMDETQLREAIHAEGGDVLLEGPGGPALWTLHDDRMTCIINHPEYSEDTLEREYKRDSAINPSTARPLHYDLNSSETLRDFEVLRGFCQSFYKNLLIQAEQQKKAHRKLSGKSASFSEKWLPLSGSNFLRNGEKPSKS